MENAENENIDSIEKSENNPFSAECNETASEANCEEVETEITSLKGELDKVNNQYLRLAADFDNYRKRQMQERESLLKYGAEDTLKKMIEALDNIDRAVTSAETSEDAESVRESYNVGIKQLYDVLNKVGLELIDTKEAAFDPNFHEAVMQTPTNEYPEHTIIAELQKGYKLGDKVLRPALVNVAVSE